MIDDQPRSLEPLSDELEERALGFETKICDFASAQDSIEEFRPAAVVLDLLEQHGPGRHKVVGDEAYELIWGNRFCPILIYSAQPDELTTEEDHPFVRRVKKGRRSEVQAADILEEFAPYATGLLEAAKRMEGEVHKALRRVAPALQNQPIEVLERAVLRQVAASVDTVRFEDNELAPWEQYVYPPVESSLITGDLLRRNDGEPTDPTAFRLVLSPACDLVSEGGRAPKISEVLVAACSPLSSLVNALNPDTKELNKKARGKLPRLLNTGFGEGLLVLPGFTDIIPSMVADLRSLGLIPFEDVGTTDAGSAPYLRIASIDSPFRELVTWAYLQTTGRPGLPTRDLEAWKKEIYEAVGTGRAE